MSSCGEELGLQHEHADGDGVRADPRNFAGERSCVVQKLADPAIAEARDVTKFPAAMQNLNGTGIVRVVRLRPQRQGSAGPELGECGVAVIVTEAGDRERGRGKVEIRGAEVFDGCDHVCFQPVIGRVAAG